MVWGLGLVLMEYCKDLDCMDMQPTHRGIDAPIQIAMGLTHLFGQNV